MTEQEALQEKVQQLSEENDRLIKWLRSEITLIEEFKKNAPNTVMPIIMFIAHDDAIDYLNKSSNQ